MFETIAPEETNFLRLLLKCDANLSQEHKHLKNKKKLARKDFTEYVENIAKLRQMLSVLESDPKRSKTDADLVVYKDRVVYLDKKLTELEVEATPVPMSMIPPPAEEAHVAPSAELSGMGGCTFMKAAAKPAAEPMSGGCIFKPAAKPAAEPMSGGCIFKPAAKPSAAPAVCPVSHQSTDAGSCPASNGESTEDLFKKAEGMGGCPMFQASPEEAEEMRKQVAEGKEFMEAQKQAKCPMTGAPSSGGGCPMAAEGDHPELEGTWMAPVTDDPNECPTFLPRPIIEAPKYASKKKIKADDGLVWLEEADKAVRDQLEYTLEKLKKGEEADLLEETPVKPLPIENKECKEPTIQECPVHSVQNFVLSHLQHIWGATAVVVVAFLVTKMAV